MENDKRSSFDNFEVGFLKAINVFMLEEKENEALKNLLKYIVNNFHAENGYVHFFSGLTQRFTVNYSTEDSKVKLVDFDGLDSNRKFVFPKNDKDRITLIKDVEAIKESQPDVYHLLTSVKIKSSCLVRIVHDNQYIGVIAINNFDKNSNLSELENTMLSLAYFISIKHILVLRTNRLEYDPITHLPNSMSFISLLNNQMKVPPLYNYYLIKIDISGFKNINEYFGIEYGNTVLRTIAKCLLSPEVGQALIATRLANSDFFYLLVDEGPNVLYAYLMNLMDTIHDSFAKANFFCNFGVFRIDDRNENFDSMNAKVSLAHKKAHDSKINRMWFYEKSLYDKSLKEQELVSNFPTAISKDEFVIYIQPKYDLSTNTYYGGEVLARWIKDGKMISPGEFIPCFEKNGMIATLDRYIFTKTLLLIKQWMEEKKEVVPLSINLSRIDFLNDNLFYDLLNLCDLYKVPHKYIQFEITESAYIEQEQDLMEFIRHCKREQFKVLMDDFGSGYSSLNTLKDIDVSEVKLDYKFFHETEDFRTKRQNIILTSIVSMCRALDIPVVAEGIEQKKDALFLQSIGVNYIQGYLYGKPMPADEFIKLNRRPLSDRYSVYTSNLYSDFFNLKSGLISLLNNSIIAAGLFKFNYKELQLIRGNETLLHSPLFGDKFVDFASSDVLSLLNIEEKHKSIAYLNKVVRGEETEKFIQHRLISSNGEMMLKMHALLLKKYDNYSILYVECYPSNIGSNSVSFEAGEAFSLKQIQLLFDDSPDPYFALSKNKIILYVNKKASVTFPNCKIGNRCKDIRELPAECDNCPLQSSFVNKKIVLKISHRTCELYAREINVRGESWTMIKLKPHEATGDTPEYDMVRRMNDTILREIDAYGEIDFSNGTYKNLFTADICQFFDLPSQGNYVDLYNHMLTNHVDEETYEEYKLKMSYDYIQKAEKDGVNEIMCRYKLIDNGCWLECHIGFYRSGQTNYACMSTKNVTAEFNSHHDSLTGLFNRSSGRDLINDYLEKNLTDSVYFLMFDFDRFKEINDTYGHPFGDAVLLKISEIIKSINKDFQFGTRLGGDEFCFLVTGNKTEDEIEEIKANLQEEVKKIGADLKIKLKTSISMGLSVCPLEGLSFRELYVAADQKMYNEKKEKKISLK